MTDLYLRFSDEAQARSVLYTKVPTAWDYTDPENPVETEWVEQPNYANIDVIGVIYEPMPDPLPEPPPAPIAKDGWHVNVRVVDEDPTPLKPYEVIPTDPRRIWG